MALTILYVEDDPNDAVAFERALKKSGLPLNLQIAPDGKFAVEYLLGHDQYADRAKYPLPQIVVSDMKMYRMTGVELLQWIRSDTIFRELPVVLYSTSNEDVDVSIAAASGATAYFRKTFQCTEVIEYLRKWMAERGTKKSQEKPAAQRSRTRANQTTAAEKRKRQ
jgi:CheY-like chemotaxis protein